MIADEVLVAAKAEARQFLERDAREQAVAQNRGAFGAIVGALYGLTDEGRQHMVAAVLDHFGLLLPAQEDE